MRLWPGTLESTERRRLRVARPKLEETTRREILREHDPGSSVRATCRRLKQIGVSVSEATARRVLRESGAIAGSTRAATETATPDAVASAVEDDAAEGRVGLLRKRLEWVGRLIDGLMPVMESGDGAAAGVLQKYMAIESALVKTLHEIEPRADRESEEMRRLGELANREIVERARANASGHH